MQGVIACELHTFTWAMWYFPGASGTMSIMGTPSTTGVCLFQVNSGLRPLLAERPSSPLAPWLWEPGTGGRQRAYQMILSPICS
jgi:hypothetical protein